MGYGDAPRATTAAMSQGQKQLLLGTKITHLLAIAVRIGFKGSNDIGQVLRKADRRPRHHANLAPGHIAYHCLATVHKPERHTRVENLKRGRIPPIAKHQLACLIPA
jgi:hypothetical protein